MQYNLLTIVFVIHSTIEYSPRIDPEPIPALCNATYRNHPLKLLYNHDETAWLETMAALATEGRASELDLRNLGEYLSDMARCDKREVFSRLVVLVAHLLKWDAQPDIASYLASGRAASRATARRAS